MKHSLPRPKSAVLCAIVFAMAASLSASADTLHLKDGKTIEGTIVGYQGNSFRVKTSYGFALVKRSSVVSITVSPPASGDHTAKASLPEKSEAAKHNSRASEPASPVAKRDADSHSAGDKRESDSKASAAAPSASSQQASPTNASVDGTQAPTAPNSQPPNPQSKDPAQSTPPSQPLPVREEVQGNLYINETYGFRMFKPPDWELIAGARAALPGAIVALGTPDETTYLIVGLEPSGDTLESHLSATNERLANSFENFRASVPRQVVISGARGYEYKFHGATSRENTVAEANPEAASSIAPEADSQPWNGIVILLQHGNDFFSFFGVTSANSDLVQIQQNVIQRTVWSLQFTN